MYAVHMPHDSQNSDVHFEEEGQEGFTVEDAVKLLEQFGAKRVSTLDASA